MYQYFENYKLIDKNNNVLFILKIDGIPYYNMDYDKLEQDFSFIYNLIDNLKIGTTITKVDYISPEIYEKGEFFTEKEDETEYYLSKISDTFHLKKYTKRITYLFINYDYDKNIKIDTFLKNCEQNINTFINNLNKYEIESQLLDEEEAEQIYCQFNNFDFNSNVNYKNLESSGINPNKYFKWLYVNNYPAEIHKYKYDEKTNFYQNLISEIIYNSNVPHILITQIKIQNNNVIQTKIQEKIQYLKVQSSFLKNILNTGEIELLEHYEDNVKELAALSFHYISWSNNVNKLEQDFYNVINFFEDNKIKITDNSSLFRKEFKYINPFNQNYISKYAQLLTKYFIPCMFDITNNKQNNEYIRGYPIYYEENNLPICLNLKNPFGVGTRHYFTYSESGGGKSTFTGYNVLNTIFNGGYVFIIDKIPSYDRIVEVFEDQALFYNFQNNKEHFGSNPFDILKIDNKYKLKDKITNDNGVEEIIDQSQIIINIFSEILNEGKNFNNAEQNTIFEFLEYFYNKLNHTQTIATFNLIADEFLLYLNNLKKADKLLNTFDILFIENALKGFRKGGQYDYIFNNKEEIDFKNKKLIVYNVEGIEETSICSLIMLLMIDKVNKLAFSLPIEVKKDFIIDEAWSLFKSQLAKTIVVYFRTLRKINCGIGVITQNINDLKMNTDVFNAIISTYGFFFKIGTGITNDEEYILKNNCGISDSQIDILKQPISYNKKEYRIINIGYKEKNFMHSYRFIVPEYFKYIIFTDPETRTEIKNIRQKYLGQGQKLSQLDAIKIILKNKSYAI